MRNHRIRRVAGRRKPLLLAGSRAARVPRLRLGRASRCCEDDGLDYVRAVGNLAHPEGGRRAERLAGRRTGLGHTRWATHGRVTRGERAPADRLRRRQARDRRSTASSRTTASCKASLLDGRATRSRSETDAEVVAHLVERHYDGDLVEAVRARLRRARGPLRLRRHPPRPPATCSSARGCQCPLVVGVGDGEMFLASSIAAFLRETRRVQFIDDGEIVAITPDGATLRRRRRRASSARRSRSTGTTRAPRRAATRRSCSRRSTSSPTPCARRSASASATARLELDGLGLDRRRASATCAASSSSPAAPPTTPASSAAT